MGGWIFVLSLMRGLDVSTYCVAQQHGSVELNPWLPQSCSAQIGVQAGIGVLQGVALHRLAPHHPKLAKVLGSVVISVEVGATAMNLRQIHK